MRRKLQIDVDALYDQFSRTGRLRIPFSHKLIGVYILIRWASVLLSKPKVFVRTIMDKKLKSGKRQFRALSVVVDYNCNIKCSHCNVAETMMHSDKQRLTLEDYRDLDRQASALGNLGYYLTGGGAVDL